MDIEFKTDRGSLTTFSDGEHFAGRIHIGDLPRGTDLTGFDIEQSGANQVANVVVYMADPLWVLANSIRTPIPDFHLSEGNLRRGVGFEMAELNTKGIPIKYIPGQLKSK